MIRFMKKLVERRPWIAIGVQRLYRRFQPRYTIGAVGILFNEKNQVLLVEHAFHTIFPWGLPGGWVDGNELPSRAVEREFREETGLHVAASYPIDVWGTHYWRNHIDLAFLVTLTEPAPDELVLSSELTSYRWTDMDDLPPLIPVQRRVIALAQHFPDPETYHKT
jgi:8-oxo-dGTP pyrophosphatase MutT (NUDIX family)